MPRKGQSNASIAEIAAAVVILGAVVTFFFCYPTVDYVAQGDTEVVPLERINDQRSYIQLKNSGCVAAVAITVNFSSSDGSIHFKNDKGQIKDSFWVGYLVDPNEKASFPFTPVFNDSLKNATLIVRYRSNIKFLPNLPPRHAEDYWVKVYGKTDEKTEDMRTKWKLR